MSTTTESALKGTTITVADRAAVADVVEQERTTCHPGLLDVKQATSQPRTNVEHSLVVGDVMVGTPKTHLANATVADIKRFFTDDHVHAAILLGPHGRLLAVLERGDVPDSIAPNVEALPYGRLTGRITSADADLELTRRAMCRQRIRRLAVVDHAQRLVGLLCLKRNGNGFCSASDIHERAVEQGRRIPSRLR